MKLNHSILLLVLATVAGTSCARRGVTRMPNNLVGGQQPLGGNLGLTIEKTGDGDLASYDLYVHWTGLERIQLRANESLVITADGQRMVFSAAEKDVFHDMACDAGPCVYDDRAYYPTAPTQLRTIAGAKNVVVQVVGMRRSVEREFTEDNFDRFREYVAKYLPPGD